MEFLDLLEKSLNLKMVMEMVMVMENHRKMIYFKIQYFRASKFSRKLMHATFHGGFIFAVATLIFHTSI